MPRRRNTPTVPEVIVPAVSEPLPELNITIDQDDMCCACDHETYVAYTMSESEEHQDEELIVGTICIKRKTWFLTEIKHVKVRDSYKRRGIATKMINYVCEHYGKMTVITMGTVKTDNEPMITLLTKLGYSKAMSFVNPETGNELFYMVKNIA